MNDLRNIAAEKIGRKKRNKDNKDTADDSSVGSNSSIGGGSVSSYGSSRMKTYTTTATTTTINHAGTKKVKDKNKSIPTRIVFISLTGERNETKLNCRPQKYDDLQREIARHSMTRNPTAMYVVQTEKGKKVFPHNFSPMDRFMVREILIPPPSLKVAQSLPIDWEDEHRREVKINGG